MRICVRHCLRVHPMQRREIEIDLVRMVLKLLKCTRPVKRDLL